MPLRVLLATDDSDPARCAESWIVRLPRTPPPAVDVVCVAGPGIARFGWAMQTYRAPIRDALEQLRTGELRAAERVANAVSDRLQAAGLRTHAWARQGDAGEELLAAIDDLAPDLVAVGPRGRSLLSELLLGSVSHRLVVDAPRPVLVARPPRTGTAPLPSRVVFVVHDAPGDAVTSRWLAKTGILGLADALVLGAREGEGHAGPEPSLLELDEHARSEAEAALRAVVEPLATRTAHLSLEVGTGHPVEDAFAAVRRHDADLVVVSRPTPRRASRPLAEEIARHAGCSVLVVPAS